MSDTLAELHAWLGCHTRGLVAPGRMLYVRQFGDSLLFTMTGGTWRTVLRVDGWRQTEGGSDQCNTLAYIGGGFHSVVPTREELYSAMWELPGSAGHPDARSVDDVVSGLVLTFGSTAFFAPLQILLLSGGESQSSQMVALENHHHHNHLLSVWLCAPPHTEQPDQFVTTVDCATVQTKGRGLPFHGSRFMLRLPVAFFQVVLDQAALVGDASCNTTLTISKQGSVWIEQQNRAAQMKLSAVTADVTVERVDPTH